MYAPRALNVTYKVRRVRNVDDDNGGDDDDDDF